MLHDHVRCICFVSVPCALTLPVSGLSFISIKICSVQLHFKSKVRPISKGMIKGSPQMFRIFICQEENLLMERM